MQTISLNFIPNGIAETVYVNQTDLGRQFGIKVFNAERGYSIPTGSHVSINGKKADKHVFLYTEDDTWDEAETQPVISWSGSDITISTTEQMTAYPGEVEVQVQIESDGRLCGTLNFRMNVQEMPAANGDISGSDLPVIIAEATEQMEAAALSATAAANSATAAATSASSASESKTAAKTSEDNAKASETAAASSEEVARLASLNPPKISGTTGNWLLYNVTTHQYEDSGIDASITVNIADMAMIPQSASSQAPYVTNTGTNTDPIFHLFIPYGVGIQSVSKTSASGLVDTYTIQFSDGTSMTYTVTNGKSAYQSAVEGGYTGTEADFEGDLSHFGSWATTASAAAISAAGSANSASGSATSAEFWAGKAEQYAGVSLPSFILEDNKLYVDDGTQADWKVENNRLYVKLV